MSNSFMNGLMKKLKMVQDEDPYDEFEDEVEAEEEPKERREKRNARTEEEADEERPDSAYGAYSSPSSGRTREPEREARSSKVISMSGREAGGTVDLCTIAVHGFEDCYAVAELLLEGRGVILNMEGLDMAVAQRIMDFISGACYMVNGNLQPVSKKVFIVTPQNISLSGDIAETGRKTTRGRR